MANYPYKESRYEKTVITGSLNQELSKTVGIFQIGQEMTELAPQKYIKS